MAVDRMVPGMVSWKCSFLFDQLSTSKLVTQSVALRGVLREASGEAILRPAVIPSLLASPTVIPFPSLLRATAQEFKTQARSEVARHSTGGTWSGRSGRRSDDK